MSHFNTKEEYLEFVAAWKEAAKHENNKKRRYVCDHTQWVNYPMDSKTKAKLEEKGYNVYDYYYVVPNGGHCKAQPWLTGAHFILYNILRGREAQRGFYPKGEKKCDESTDPWVSFLQSMYDLEMVVRNAKEYLTKDNDYEMKKWIKEGKTNFLSRSKRTPESYQEHLQKRYLDRVEKFIKPFGGIITVEFMASLSLDELNNATQIVRMKEVA